MKAVAGTLTCLVALAVAVAARTGAAQQAGVRIRGWPRAGIPNAAVAARNMELVTSCRSRPASSIPPRRAACRPARRTEEGADAKAAESLPAKTGSPDRRRLPALDFANSDLAFSGTRLFVGNFSGINIYDIKDPRRPSLVTSLLCPGGQGDVSIHGNLLFMSVEQSRGRVDCGTTGVAQTVSTERFRGVRIFDISDIRSPRQVAAVQTCRGSHTHTLLVDPKDTAHVYIYGSGTANVRATEELEGCSRRRRGPEHRALQHRRDQGAARSAGQGGDRQPAADLRRSDHRRDRRHCGLEAPRSRHAEDQRDRPVPRHHGLPRSRPRRWRVLGQRHPARHHRSREPQADRPGRRQELRLLALRDVQQRRHQGDLHRRVGRRHAAALPRDRSADWGANAIFDIVDRKLQFASYYKLPAAQTEH